MSKRRRGEKRVAKAQNFRTGDAEEPSGGINLSRVLSRAALIDTDGEEVVRLVVGEEDEKRERRA